MTGENLVLGLDWVVNDVARRLYYSSVSQEQSQVLPKTTRHFANDDPLLWSPSKNTCIEPNNTIRFNRLKPFRHCLKSTKLYPSSSTYSCIATIFHDLPRNSCVDKRKNGRTQQTQRSHRRKFDDEILSMISAMLMFILPVGILRDYLSSDLIMFADWFR